VLLFWLVKETPPEDRFTLDHVIPVSRGGEHTYANIQATCQPCNNAKGNETNLMPNRGHFSKDNQPEKKVTQKKVTPDQVKGTAPGQNPVPGTRRWARSKGLPVDGPESDD